MPETRGANKIKSEPHISWSEEEKKQLMDWVSGQSEGADYQPYRKAIEKIDWTKCPIEKPDGKGELIKMIKNVKKHRTLFESLTDYLNTYLIPAIESEEMESIEMVDDNSNHENPIQVAQPVEIEATGNVPKKRKQATKINKTERAGEVEIIENLDKKIKREIEIDQNGEVEITENFGKRDNRRRNRIKPTERFAEVETAESFNGKVKRENEINPAEEIAEVESAESRGKKVKRKNEMIKTERGAEVKRVKNCKKCGKQKKNVMKFTVTDINGGL